MVRGAFEEHLRDCPTCVTYLQNYRAAIRLGKSAALASGPEPALPEELVRAILEALRAQG
jgi:anti-sigma factor RsiW